MNWYLAPSLAALRDEANRLYPDRSKASDGTIGDQAHATRTSDHNPKPDGHGGMVVDAIDLTHDPLAGFHAHQWVRTRTAARDPRIKYAISAGQIWTPERGWVTYTGTNAHNHHVHVSVKGTDPARTDTSPWFVTAPQQEAEMNDTERALLQATHDKARDAVNYLTDAQARLVAMGEKVRDAVNYAVDTQARLVALQESIDAHVRDSTELMRTISGQIE